MAIDPPGTAHFRQRLLTQPSERQDVDYKASLPFLGDDSFSLKLVRYILGMANSGGGWLVIGFSEATDEGLVPDSSHDESTCASYDPTTLHQRVNSSVERGQSVQMKVYVERHPDTGQRHPIVRVLGFTHAPVVCRSDKAAADTDVKVLRKGAVYVRRPGAETVPLSTQQDWEEMIERCVALRRNQFISELRGLLEEMLGPLPSRRPSAQAPRPATQEFEEWMDEMRAESNPGEQD